MPGPEMVVLHGRKTAALEHPWSTIVRMALKPLLASRPIIRSIATVLNGRVSVVGMQYVGMCYLWVLIFIC